ncbi:expressed unknown protein [Seminavis robusta]|uniref:Uncharacterized protein n=1 Tax=Seminavis robusta TaxID=568900 RepID=A0A9N8EX86_9STRA|nr:expressed unknown protein [Seminavis robusta]|eukprot:Sro2642_g333460.1 n/a (326) ;mRNA; f:5643-6994
MYFTIFESLSDPHKRRGPIFAILWLVWLFVGTIFFALAPGSDLGWVKGFYMAINVGYSIGFGYPAESEEYPNYLYFSSFYVLVGSSFVAVALGFFADKISEDHDNWFTNLIQQREYEEAFSGSGNFASKASAIFDFYAPTLRAVAVWLIALGIMISYSMLEFGWSYNQAQYFAIGTLSTGGLYRIPDDSATWMFAVTAVFACLGVPIMAVAMAEVARGLMDKGDLEATKASVNEPVTAEELIMLQKFGLENGDGEIDRAEFIILCMVRMGTDPNLIEFISHRFHQLDEDGGGTLSILEITAGKYEFIDGQIKAVIPDDRPKSNIV